jgi:aminoglycoside phosphotransferase (APT) family kinase protein
MPEHDEMTHDQTMRAGDGGDGVLEGLSRFADLPDWLSAVMDPARLAEALSSSVPELVSGALEIVECETERLRAKEQDWQVRCRVTVAPSGRPDDARTVVLVGTLGERGGRPDSAAPADTAAPAHTAAPADTAAPAHAAAPAGAAARHAFGDPGWSGLVDVLGLTLRVEQADPGLPVLPSLVDPVPAAQVLQACLRAGAYPDAVVRACEPDVVRYKPGSRCTIVYRVHYGAGPDGDGAGPDPLVVKTHQGDKGRTAFEAMTALWRTPLARGNVLTLAEPIAYLPDERVLVQGPVPEERTLKELARQAFTGTAGATLEELREALAGTAVALAALHASGARYGGVATWEDEVAEVREVVGRLARGVPELGTAAEPLLRRLEQVAADVPADPTVSAHHDFRPAQVLLDGRRIGFIDFDGASMAEPGLDIGRFRAKLRDIGVSVGPGGARPTGSALRERLELLDELCEHFVDRYRQESPVTPERVMLWETVDLVTTLLHAWTKVRTARVAPRLALLEHQALVAGMAEGELSLA